MNVACHQEATEQATVQDLAKRQVLAAFNMQWIRGRRDGDRLRTETMFSDSSSMLTLEMRFAIGSPTTLELGSWHWNRDNQLVGGTIAARSVTFLGGQDGPPSIGGSFDLLGADGKAEYRVKIPVTELKRTL